MSSRGVIPGEKRDERGRERYQEFHILFFLTLLHPWSSAQSVGGPIFISFLISLSHELSRLACLAPNGGRKRFTPQPQSMTSTLLSPGSIEQGARITGEAVSMSHSFFRTKDLWYKECGTTYLTSNWGKIELSKRQITNMEKVKGNEGSCENHLPSSIERLCG